MENFTSINMIEYLILLLAIPFGILLSRLAYDELEIGRKWFLGISVLGVIGGVIFFRMMAVSFTLFFMGVVAFVSWRESGRSG